MRIQYIMPIVLLAGLSGPSLAYAYCPEPRRYMSVSFEDQVSKYIDYLLCLHNEQVASLNEHARLINQLSDEIFGLRATAGQGQVGATSAVMREVLANYSAMSAQNEQLRQRIEELEARIVRIEDLAGAE